MSLSKKLFGPKAAHAPTEEDMRALVQLVQRNLFPFLKGPSGAEELFADADEFLTALEMRAAGSAMLQIHTKPATARSAARIGLHERLLKGAMPFFYKDIGNSTVFVSDTHVRARDLAEHAAWLLKHNQVALAGVYAEALHDIDRDMKTFAELQQSERLSYSDGKNVGQLFEFGADEDHGRPIQPVLRRKSPGNQPS